jgi:hemoglobin
MTEKFDKINEDTLRVMLTDFYDKVRKDDLIGPIFNNKIGTTDEDWAPHMDRVVAFWCSVLLGAKTYGGGFMIKHAQLPNLEMTHFKRWMELFMPSVSDHYQVSQSIEITIKAQTLMRNLHQQYGQFQVRKAQLGDKLIQ